MISVDHLVVVRKWLYKRLPYRIWNLRANTDETISDRLTTKAEQYLVYMCINKKNVSNILRKESVLSRD